MNAAPEATAAAAPAPISRDQRRRLEVKGCGGTKVCAHRSVNSVTEAPYWWLAVYYRDVQLAAGIGKDGQALDFDVDDASDSATPAIWLGSMNVHLPKASWQQLKAWAEGLTAEGT